MPNIYVINTKTLYDSENLQYQYTNREHFFQNHTTYVFQDLQAKN